MVVISNSSAPVASWSCSSWSATLVRGADELGVHAVGDQCPVRVGPGVRAGLFGRGELDGALGGADAADPQAVAGGEFAGGRLVLGDDDVGRDADVRLVEHVGRLERGAVALRRLQHRRRADVVVRGEAQTVAAGDLGALPAAAAQDPHLDVGALARHDMCLDAVRGPVGAGQQREDVVDLLGVVLRLGLRLLEQCCGAARTAASRAGARRRSGAGSADRSVCARRRPGSRSAAGRSAAPGGRPPERPRPRSSRPGCRASIRPNSSTVDSAVRCPSCTAPEPSRIVEVAAAVSARTTAGEVPATPGLRWCSANQ